MSTSCVAPKIIPCVIFIDIYSSLPVHAVCFEKRRRTWWVYLFIFCLPVACHTRYPHLPITRTTTLHLSLKLHRSVWPTAGRRRTKCLWSLPYVKWDSPHCQWLSLCQMKGAIFGSCPLTGGRERGGGSKGAPWRVVKGAVEDGVRALFNLSKLTNASSSCPRCTHTSTERRGL